MNSCEEIGVRFTTFISLTFYWPLRDRRDGFEMLTEIVLGFKLLILNTVNSC